MDFTRYQSIDNSYRLKTIGYIQEGLPGATFVVQEKIHGSNFGAFTDGEEVKFGKIGSFLKEGDSFYNYEVNVDIAEYSRKIKEMFEFAKRGHPHIKQLEIRGEICGGSYPHPDVEKVAGVSRVQSEVLYSPNIHVLAFDIKIDGEFVNMNVFTTLCEQFDIPYLPLLFKGTLEECLNYSNEYPPHLPGLLGLPPIEDNVCEGNVIKPLITARFDNGKRVVVKNKNAKFSEKSGQKGTPQSKDPVPQHVMDMMEKGSIYVCENRLKNVLSHIGGVQQNEFGKILGLMSKDVIEDFVKDEPEFLEMDRKERKEVTRFLNGKIGFLIRGNFSNIIDGTYC
jgi:Rnl2 family RNA ligase